MSGMVLGSGKTAVSKRQPLPSMRSEQCVVKLTTAVVMIRTASKESQLLEGRAWACLTCTLSPAPHTVRGGLSAGPEAIVFGMKECFYDDSLPTLLP